MKQTIEINQDWCKGCKICINICPENILIKNTYSKAYAPVNAEKECPKGCNRCELTCPDLAITING